MPATKRGKRRTAKADDDAPSSKKARVDETNTISTGKKGASNVQHILGHRLTRLALERWRDVQSKCDDALTAQLYNDELRHATAADEHAALLDLSRLLEHYLWPTLTADATVEHVLATLCLINEKLKDNLANAFEFVAEDDDERFGLLITLVTQLSANSEAQRKTALSWKEQTTVVLFLINCYQSLEHRIIRKFSLKLLSLPTWNAVNTARRNKEFESIPKLGKHWKKLSQKFAKTGAPLEATFIPDIFEQFKTAIATVCQQVAADSQPESAMVEFVAHVGEFLRDVESQLPTRRFAWLVIDAMRVIPCASVALQSVAKENLGLLRRQLAAIESCHSLPIDSFRGVPLEADESDALHCSRIQELQQQAYKVSQAGINSDDQDAIDTREACKQFALANVGSVDTRETMFPLLDGMQTFALTQLAQAVHMIDQDESVSREELLETFIQQYQRHVPPEHEVSKLPLYPTDSVIWDTALIPEVEFSNRRDSLALPKMGLQYLAMRDYLLRSFELYRLASTYDVRLDLEDSISLLKPHISTVRAAGAITARKHVTSFAGVARMGIELTSCVIDRVGRPLVGALQPSSVEATLSYSLKGVRQNWRSEWDALRQYDVMFLVSLDASKIKDLANLKQDEIESSSTFMERYGVQYVRGCSVVDVCDGNGKVVPEDPETGLRQIGGQERQVRVLLDAAQYKIDHDARKTAPDHIYRSFNVLIRRKPKENNFKHILEAIRDLLRDNSGVPNWLHDSILGYGDPSAAAAGIERDDDEHNLGSVVGEELDFFDTFLDADHVRESFAQHNVKFEAEASSAPSPPYRRKFVDSENIVATAFTASETSKHRGTQRNPVRFTATQVDAIRRGMSQGLALIVGPPGTGKTDVAVQIISNLYHSYPNERILLVTHSNQALNQLFDKLVKLDIDSRHMLRLGHGASQLESEQDFSRFGRVTYMLSRRLELLEKATNLLAALPNQTASANNDVSSCQLAAFVFAEHILPQYNAWRALGGRLEFPFGTFVREERSMPNKTPLLPGDEDGADMDKVAAERLAKGAEMFEEIRAIFDELADCRAFEIMRSARHRTNYLATQQARIVALTTTHAAIRRADLVELGFQFDTLVMEEAAQVLEVETFVPLLLQRDSTRLRRVTLIGDHRQLPPVVKNSALRRFARFDQSLFARFVRLGVPHVVLDQQGRARPQLSALYSWRYENLRDLPSLAAAVEGKVDGAQTLSDGSSAGAAFSLGNAGLAHVAQVIDVPDYQGVGESTPTPHYYQNLGEAEYVVALFMYMRILGYPASRISILTTYNGQKRLIRDVIEARCAHNKLFGRPKRVSTVDRYQGQQNDYILLSLVRTKSVGHLRDVRRLIVAMSRARLGLYVFCRKALFANCYELTPTFSKLLTVPDQLELVRDESYGNIKRGPNEAAKDSFTVDLVSLGQLVAQSQ